MVKVAIRVDASVEIGTGHVMRCLTLAEELKNHNINVIFVSRVHEGHMCDIIESKGYKVIRLKRIEMNESSIHIDAAETINQLRGIRPIHLLIVDHYVLDYRWENQLRQITSNIMVIDDMANREHNCEILLDQNYYLNKDSRYNGLVPKHCKLLLGPKYGLLRKEFKVMRRTIRIRDGSIRRILISFGGSDATNETQKAIEAVLLLNDKNIQIDVVIGHSNPNKARIKNFANTHNNINCYVHINNISKLMVQADLAIGAGGITIWERCYLGLPTINIVIADNQREIAEAVDLFGAIKNIGYKETVTVQTIYKCLLAFVNDREIVRNMSDRACQLMNDSNRESELYHLLFGKSGNESALREL